MCLLAEILAHSFSRRKRRVVKKGRVPRALDWGGDLVECVCVCVLVALWEGGGWWWWWWGGSAAVKCATAIYRPS